MQILFVRHSDAVQIASSDFERPLSDIGKVHAQEAAKNLRALELMDFLALVSPALRTVETWNIFSQALHHSYSMKLVEELYNSSLESYMQVIESNRFSNLMIIGHNPAISQTISMLLHREIDLAPSEWMLLEINENLESTRLLNLHQVTEN